MVFHAILWSSPPGGSARQTPMKQFGIIMHHFKPSAFRRTVGPERAEDHMATWLDSSGDLPDVGKALLRFCKKFVRKWNTAREQYSTFLQISYKTGATPCLRPAGPPSCQARWPCDPQHVRARRSCEMQRA